jgi:glycosidase
MNSVGGRSRTRARTFAWLVGAIAASALYACGSDAPRTTNFGDPPDAAIFDPGHGGNGDGYGSGGNGGSHDAGPPVCPADLKRCAETFTFPFAGETSLELRGDYRADGWTKGDAMVHSGNAWTVSVQVPYGQPVQYKFIVSGGATWVNDPANPKTVPDGNGNTNSLRDAITCTTFTCDEPPPPPVGVFDWRDAVIYFVFVDRFFDGDATNNCSVAGADAPGQYKGGDWKGVAQKINDGYFTDLGVNTLWITVPVKNATVAGHGVGGDTHQYSAYHGYWPKEPTATESCFGTKAELTSLVSAAHAKKMKVLFDYAMVHVHNSSSVFTQHPDWFWPNSFQGHDCICGQGCDWNAQAQSCWFTDYLPHWNYTNASARDYSVNAAVQLVKDTGVDGFRLDAIKHVDGSWLLQLRNQITSQVVATQNPPQRFYMVGETYDFGDRNFIKSFVDPQTKLDGQFDFPLRLNLSKAVLLRQEGMDALRAFMDSNDGFYGANAIMSTFIGNHDLPRSIHIGEDTPLWGDPYSDGKNLAWSNQPQLSQSANAYERLANAFGVLLTNRGAPLFYYGDEIGLPGAGDPDNRRMMQFGGLTANQQFLHDRVKALNAIRAAHPALRRGQRTTLSVTTDVWLYSMTTSGDTVYVAINRGDADAGVTGLPSLPLTELVGGTTVNGPNATIPARQTRVFIAK